MGGKEIKKNLARLNYLNAYISNLSQFRNHQKKKTNTVTKRMNGMFKLRITKKSPM